MAAKPKPKKAPTNEGKIRDYVIFGGQVAICRFLVSEGLIDRGRLVASLVEKQKLWEKNAGPAGGAAVRILLTGISSEKEPEFPRILH